MINFNKEHVAETMVENNPELSKTKAQEQLDEVLVAIIGTLAKGKDEAPNKKGVRAKFTAVGFGSFELKAVPERKHRNPQTQEPTIKKAHNAVKFNEGKSFVDSIN